MSQGLGEHNGASGQLSPFELLRMQIEAILFSAESALEVPEIRHVLGPEVPLADVRMALKDLALDYSDRAFFLFECGGRFQLRTKPEYAEIIRKQFSNKPKSLSKSALETLAIVAYRQPVTRAEVNAIRSVDSSSILASLKDRELIYVSGTRKEVGSPMEYRTTQKFLEIFGLSELSQLPSLRSLQVDHATQKQLEKALEQAEKKAQGVPDSPEPPLTV